jgi:plastocyanin
VSQRARLAQQQRAQRRAILWIVGGVVAVVVLALVAVIATSGGDDEDSGGGGGEQLRVSMTDFAFSPDPIVVDRADARLDVVNDGAVDHNLLVGELGKGTPNLVPGQSGALDLTDQPAGTYRVVCDLPGHIEAGMVTELTLR